MTTGQVFAARPTGARVQSARWFVIGSRWMVESSAAGPNTASRPHCETTRNRAHQNRARRHPGTRFNEEDQHGGRTIAFRMFESRSGGKDGDTQQFEPRAADHWRMPPLDHLPPARLSTPGRIWMIVLRAYLVIAAGLVLIRSSRRRGPDLKQSVLASWSTSGSKGRAGSIPERQEVMLRECDRGQTWEVIIPS